MQHTRSNSILVATVVLLCIVGCGKKNANTSAKGSKDTSAHVKDTTGGAKDSASATNDSTTGKKDSTIAMSDSARTADSLAAHPVPVMSYEQRQGSYVYAKYCAVCHGIEGKADGFNTYNLDPKPRDFTEQHYLSEFTDQRLIDIIRDGGRGANKSPSMPPYGWTLGKDDITYVAAFVRTFMPPDTTKPAPQRAQKS
jgi:mono/diheme cytochrome c family protein